MDLHNISKYNYGHPENDIKYEELGAKTPVICNSCNYVIHKFDTTMVLNKIICKSCLKKIKDSCV